LLFFSWRLTFLKWNLLRERGKGKGLFHERAVFLNFTRLIYLIGIVIAKSALPSKAKVVLFAGF
jgi:hypothetical protein